MLQPCRPTKLRNRDQQVLSKYILKNSPKKMTHIPQEFQPASGIVILINTIRTEVYFLGFYSLAAAHKSMITKSNHAARLRWCKALRNWTIDVQKQVFWNEESRFNIYQLEEKSGLVLRLKIVFSQNSLCLQ
ncbi:transposable element tcb1 transposase [Trichonephila clavipes]|nr:transposable element tcb1 transposase [Trichonephila clavipes]